MHLTAQTDYALRTLMFVAVQKEQCTIAQVAEHYGISRNHLVVIAHRLGKLGFLQNSRGQGGGLRLGKPADQIGVGSVVRALEPFELVECFAREHSACLITGECRLRGLLERALESWLAVLDGATLADLVKGNRDLVNLLRIAN